MNSSQGISHTIGTVKRRMKKRIVLRNLSQSNVLGHITEIIRHEESKNRRSGRINTVS